MEKGYINDVNDPLLYNSESLKVNQIKQLEVPLKDETGCGWVVGYIPSDAFKNEEGVNSRVEKDIDMPMDADIEVNGLSNWEYWNYCSSNPNYRFMADTAGRREVTVKIRSQYIYADSGRSASCNLVTADFTFFPGSTDPGVFIRKNSGTIPYYSGSSFPQWYQDYAPVTLAQRSLDADACNNIFGSVRNNNDFNNALNVVLGSSIDIGDTTSLRNLQDKIILDSSTNTYYRIRIINTSEASPITVDSSISGGQTALNALNAAMTRPSGLTGTYTTFTASNSSQSYAIELVNVGVTVYTVLDKSDTRTHLNDAPYDMFCIPFSDTMQLTYGDTTFTCSKNTALGIATEIGKDLGTGAIYDVQLLPYCPNRDLVVKSSSPGSVLELDNIKYNLIKEKTSDSPKSAVIWCTESTFQVPISAEDTVISFNSTEESPTWVGTEIYYTIPNSLTSSELRRSISTTTTNDIKVYKVDRVTNRVIETGWYNKVELLATDVLKIYTYGNVNNPEIITSFSDYAAANYYYVFWLKNVAYGGSNVPSLVTQLRLADAHGILNPGNTVFNRKLANECDVVRLVSQNYSAVFEFSPAKSGGVNGFLADCTYKPWAPYIHILPKLKGLYGENFVDIDDARGLICGGDMSLPQLSNAWSNYQLQNKNFEVMFNREIDHMDVQNDINRQAAIAQLIAAPVIGGAAGAAAGAHFGGPYGAVAGGITGAVGGVVTGAVDYINTVKMMEENRQYAKDMHNYSLQNIQAIPTTLTKTSALTYNTRIWPFVEYYTCTDVEKEAVEDNIKYNGMTIMKICRLKDYLLGTDKFYRGQLIRMPDITEDSHVVYEIYNELNKGVYL